MKVLAVQNIECETLGTLDRLLRSDGFEIEIIDAPFDHVPLVPRDYGAIVVLGGPMAVYDNLDYLLREQELIRSAIKSDTPLLGICLGSQLIAQAAGGRVFKGSRKEIGLEKVFLTPTGRSGIFRDSDGRDAMKVFQWHGDTYDLPSSASVLARSDLYPQAFRIGSAVGIQFHLEVDKQMINRWIQEYRKELDFEGIVPNEVVPSENDLTQLASNCKVVYRNFASELRSRMLG
jgi:GMP synthase (glutamine-hydrolysing)